ncbi:MAG: hypothetical protein APG12_01031 [Candidatus Methanofastidiosum methylothiophilum]|uniref:Uncharacterized protein n=1 Tax=Candidatus Methanofastidiosum methylothiophilum TaxID=1705564 RepID=A0A150IRR7_9EURY|nr:MAG: hypothetical protein APG10_00799 [Candidatus Methanofastidiosum methylthiophilus]KYC47660.1 MAG: hypothetical protein APG11_00981 [Candidatus Methanofastidiosum methylthiophilus]KYC50121.1 MAG: hypothetical protein APG12_01031 [Candidatus Methanofastidiosum methylthiophilus]
MKKKKSINNKQSKDYVKICPNCGSINVSSESYNIGIRDVCKDCRHGSIQESLFINDLIYFPEILESDIEEFRKEIIKKKENKKD